MKSSQRTHKLVCVLIAAAYVTTTAGCINTLRVHRDKEGGGVEPAKGLPFYVKTERIVRTTVYARTWREVEFEIEDFGVYQPDGTGPQTLKTVNKQIFRRYVDSKHEDRLRQVELRVVAKDAGALAEFLALPDSVEDLVLTPRRVANQLNSTAIVDYTKPHYVNAPLPWIGSAALTPKLAPDGTLTEVAVESEANVGEVLGAIADLASTVVGFSAPTEAAPSDVAPMELDAAERATLETHRAMRLRVQWIEERDVYTKSYRPDETIDPILDATVENADYRLERLGDKPVSKPETPSSAYTFSGSLVPPKAK